VSHEPHNGHIFTIENHKALVVNLGFRDCVHDGLANGVHPLPPHERKTASFIAEVHYFVARLEPVTRCNLDTIEYLQQRSAHWSPMIISVATWAASAW